MRFGEVAGLHVEDLDFDNSVVHIRRSVCLHEETTPKTAAGCRDVDIHPDVMAMLKNTFATPRQGWYSRAEEASLWWWETSTGTC
jgi:integrase